MQPLQFWMDDENLGNQILAIEYFLYFILNSPKCFWTLWSLHDSSLPRVNQRVSLSLPPASQVPNWLRARAVPRPRGLRCRLWSSQQGGRLQLRHQKDPLAQQVAPLARLQHASLLGATGSVSFKAGYVSCGLLVKHRKPHKCLTGVLKPILVVHLLFIRASMDI